MHHLPGTEFPQPPALLSRVGNNKPDNSLRPPGSDKTVDVLYPSLGKQAKKSFTFDGTFDESTSQARSQQHEPHRSFAQIRNTSCWGVRLEVPRSADILAVLPSSSAMLDRQGVGACTSGRARTRVLCARKRIGM